MPNPLVDILPASARKVLYAVFALIGLVLGALPVFYAATDATTPDWVKGAAAVYAFVIGGLGFGTAASNVKPVAPPAPPADDAEVPEWDPEA